MKILKKISVLILVFAFLSFSFCKAQSSESQKPKVNISDVNVAEIVRAVRKSENWIHEVNSFYLRIEQSLTRTPKTLAAIKARLKKQFPDSEPTAEKFPNLRPNQNVILEYVFDRQRVRRFAEHANKYHELKIWDGRQFKLWNKYFSPPYENYFLDSTPQTHFHELIAVDTSWPRSQPHCFSWDKKDVQKLLKNYGYPEDFVFSGSAKYRGVDCYILECDRSNIQGMVKDLLIRWYVGKKDDLLYGIEHLVKGKPWWKHWMSEYKEILPSCWIPMKQGFEDYENTDEGEAYLSFSTESNVVEVHINHKLDDELFDIKFKDGVQVGDKRFGGYVVYPYKADRNEEEWQEIKKKARKKDEKMTAEKQFKDALIGQPAPDFPENTEWLNSKPLTWKDLRGKVVILDFWADWCGPCKAELPKMSDLHKKRQENGITVIGIHTPGSKMENIQKVMKKYELDYPICIDKPKTSHAKGFGKMSSEYGVNAIPYAFVIDKKGKVAGHGWRVGSVLEKAFELAKQKPEQKVEDAKGNEIKKPLSRNRLDKTVSEAAVNELLKQNVDLSILNTNMSFSDAINVLKNLTMPPLNIIVLWKELQENAGINRNSPINIDGISGISIDAALNLLLWSVGGTARSGYMVKDGAVIIASKKFLSTMQQMHVYDVTDLLIPPAEFYLEMPRYYDDYQMDY